MSLVIVIVIVFVLMLGEAWLSRVNERALRAQGAFEPPDDVYRTMAWAYPGSFIAMGLEGMIVGPSPDVLFISGVLMFLAAKAIKYWAIATLGPRWTFRVLVPPYGHLVTHGPYAWLRHPNYVGVVGELIGVALLVCAPVTGVVATAFFARLIRHRIAIEDRALGRDQRDQRGV
jgi:methyltransferase